MEHYIKIAHDGPATGEMQVKSSARSLRSFTATRQARIRWDLGKAGSDVIKFGSHLNAVSGSSR